MTKPRPKPADLLETEYSPTAAAQSAARAQQRQQDQQAPIADPWTLARAVKEMQAVLGTPRHARRRKKGAR